MKIHVLEREQLLPEPPDVVFPFFADARNLEAITPPLFEPHGDGKTLMRDTVRYALPLWPLGELAAPLVRHDLARIFDFRHAACTRHFAAREPHSFIK